MGANYCCVNKNDNLDSDNSVEVVSISIVSNNTSNLTESHVHYNEHEIKHDNEKKSSEVDIPKMIIIDDKTLKEIYDAIVRKHWFNHYIPGSYIPIRVLNINLHLFISKYVNDTRRIIKIRDFITDIFVGIRTNYLHMFDNFQIYAITNKDPDVLGASSSGHKNTGGKGYLVFNIDIVCQKAVDTIRPGSIPVFRMWDIPIHEFGHAVELTIGFKKERVEYYLQNIEKYGDNSSDEYFAWSTEKWFGNHLGYIFNRDHMARWEYNYLKKYYDEGYIWIPSCL